MSNLILCCLCCGVFRLRFETDELSDSWNWDLLNADAFTKTGIHNVVAINKDDWRLPWTWLGCLLGGLGKRSGSEYYDRIVIAV